MIWLDGPAGVTATDTRVGEAVEVTVSVVEPLMLPEAAWIVVVPVPTAVPRPVALMVATAVFEEDHVAEPVRFCVELSLNAPVAMNCSLLPF